MNSLQLVILNGSKKVGTFKNIHLDTLNLRDVRIFRHLVRDNRTKVYHLMTVSWELDRFGCEEITGIYMNFGYGYLMLFGEGEPDGEYLKFGSAQLVESEPGYVKRMIEKWEEEGEDKKWVLPPCY